MESGHFRESAVLGIFLSANLSSGWALIEPFRSENLI